MRGVLALLFSAAVGVSHAQSDWQASGMPYVTTGILRFHHDTVQDVFYCIGRVRPAGANGWSEKSLVRYDHGQWETLGSFSYSLFDAVVYHDTLIVVGYFTTADGNPIANIARYVNGTWQGMGDFSAHVNRLRVLDGVLYAAGPFQTVDGQPANGLVRWVGGQWQPVGLPPMTNPSAFMPYDVALYQGKIYLGGTFSFSGTYQDIMVWDGVSWEPVGGSLLGGMNWVSAMEVYQDKLIVGGVFDNAAGNAGNAIMAWDGSTWSSLGDGIQDASGNYHPGQQVYCLTEHDGRLFVGGTHNYAGHIPSAAISTWDGHQWCNVGDGVFNGNNVVGIGFYQDTLWVACGPYIDGDSVHYMARWVGGAYSDTCSVPVSVEEPLGAEGTGVRVAVLGDGLLAVQGLPDGRHLVHLFDAAGRAVRELVVSSAAGAGQPVRASGLEAGVYVLQVPDGRAVRFVVE